MRHVWAIVVVLSIVSGTPSYAASVDLKSGDVRDLNRLFAVLGARTSRQDVEYAEAKSRSSACPVSALAAAVLYVRNPKEYEEPFNNAFAIHDYADRSRGRYNILARERMLSDVKDIESRYKDQVEDKRVLLLLGYCVYRDQNTWMLVDGRRVSVARFFRTAFLSSILQGTQIDPVRVANEIDRRTEMQDLRR